MTIQGNDMAERGHDVAREMLGHVEALLLSPLTVAQKERLHQLRELVRQLMADAPQAAPQAHAGDKSLHILLAEDNLFNQKLMVRLLENQGHRVITVNHGRDAVVAVRDNPFDLVLMDLRMPEMDGLEAARTIRVWEAQEQRGHLPIIAVTALTSLEDQERVRQSGMNGFHGKPIRAEELFAEISRVMGGERHDPLADDEDDGSKLVNMEQLLSSMAGDWLLLKEVVELYFADAPRHMERIRQGIDTGDAPLVREAAHSLKGASGVFGHGNQMFEMALEMERMGRLGELARAPVILKKLGETLERLQRRMRATLAEKGMILA